MWSIFLHFFRVFGWFWWFLCKLGSSCVDDDKNAVLKMNEVVSIDVGAPAEQRRIES